MTTLTIINSILIAWILWSPYKDRLTLEPQYTYTNHKKVKYGIALIFWAYPKSSPVNTGRHIFTLRWKEI